MPTDATGTPTSLGIPTYNTSVDKPSGVGFNNTMAVIDALLQSRGGNLALTSSTATITLGGDTNLYRANANVLQTDDRFVVSSTGTQALTVGSGFDVDANNLRLSLGGQFSGSGNMTMFLKDSNSVPSTNPTAGVLLYSESGTLKSRNPAGVITAIAPAAGGGSFESGMMIDFAGSAAPSGWLLCDGAAVSRSTYASLFTAIGTDYGPGDGSTTFNVPDARGRATYGVGTHGDVDVRNDSDGLSVGSRTPKHTHDMGSHTHSVTITDNANAGTGGGQPTGAPGAYTTGGPSTNNTSSAGPTFLVVNKIIKT